MNIPDPTDSGSPGGWRPLLPHEPDAGGRAARRVIAGMGWALLAMIIVGWAALVRGIGTGTPGGAALAAAGLVLFVAIRSWRRRMAAFDRAMGSPVLWLPPAGGDGPPRWGTPYRARVQVVPRSLPSRAVLHARLWQARGAGEGTVRTFWESRREVARLPAGLTVDPDASGDGSAQAYAVTWMLPKRDPAAGAPFSAAEPEWWVTLEAYSDGPSSAMGARWAVHFRLGPALP